MEGELKYIPDMEICGLGEDPMRKSTNFDIGVKKTA